MFNEIYETVKKIPYGMVCSYGEIAKAIGCPKCSRQVGWALHQNPDQSNIPCHRVVNKNGGLAQGFAFGGQESQKLLLAAEGVAFSGEFTVDKKCFYYFHTNP